MLLFSLLAMALLSPRTLSKPLDVNDRITTLLNNNIATSLQEKAEAIDTILRLLSEIDLVSICEAVMIEKPNVGTNMDNIIAQAAKERAFEFMLTDKLLHSDNAPFPAELNMKIKDILPVNFPLKTSAVPMKSSAIPQDHNSPSNDGMSTRVVIDKVQSLKPNVSLSAEARRLDSQEIRRLQRPDLVGFKLVPSEHYMSEMEGARTQTEGVDGGTQAPVKPMVEGMINYAMVNGTEAAMETIAESDVNETTNSNVTADEHTTISPVSSTSRMPSSTTILSTNATITSTNDIMSDNATISSTNETSSSNDIFSSINDTISSTTTSISSNNETISTNDTLSSTSNTILSTNDTMSSNTASVLSTTTFEEEVETTTTGIYSSSTFEEIFDTTTSNEIVEEALDVSLSNISTVETANDTMNTTTTPDDFTNETQIINATESSTTHLSEAVMTELKNDTTDTVLANQTITFNEPSSHNETETVNSTEAAAVTEMNEQDTLSQNDTDLTALETASMELRSNNETSPAAETTSTTTIASSMNLTEESSPTTAATSIELSTHQTEEASTDYSPNYTDNSEEVPSTTVDYFWTPGSTIPHQNMYDYDYPSSAGQDVESRDNTIEDSVDVRGSNAVQNDTVDITTDSTTVTQYEYDYIYNLLGMLGDHRQLPAYNRYEDSKYDEPNNYAGYDVNNLEYTSDDVTDYSIDALKTSTKFLTNDHYNNDGNKKQGINMLASVDSPANTAAEDDFMLSAQPGYYNSLADQTSWKLKDNQYNENSVSNSKDYDKRFTAHSQDSKHGVTSAIASSIGVQQKTVWSEPTLPQMLYHPNGYACPGLFGYYADVSDCQAFFICSWGLPYRFLCPPGTLWNTAETVCDWANNVACNRKK